MKSIISLVTVALSASSAVAFVPQASSSVQRTMPLMAKLDMTPELEAAIADVRDAASAFGEETAHFANGTLYEIELQNRRSLTRIASIAICINTCIMNILTQLFLLRYICT